MELTGASIDAMCNEFASTAVVSTRRVGLRIVKSCLTGKDVASWLIARQYIPRNLKGDDRKAAIEKIGQAFIDRGTLNPVASKAQWSTFCPSENMWYSVTPGPNAQRTSRLGSISRGGNRRSLEIFARGNGGNAGSSMSRADDSQRSAASRGVRRSLELVGLRRAPIPPSPSAQMHASQSAQNLAADETSKHPRPASSAKPPTPNRPPPSPGRQTFAPEPSTPIRISSSDFMSAAKQALITAYNDQDEDVEYYDDDDDSADDDDTGSYGTDEPASNSLLECSPVSDSPGSAASGEEQFPRNASYPRRRARKLAHSASKPIGKQIDRMKSSKERKAELRLNTSMNRSERGVPEILFCIGAGEPCGYDEGLDFSKSDKSLNTAPVLSSQMFDPANLKKLYQATGYKLRFNERVHLRRINEDGDLIENLRVPIDYSIKTKLHEPQLDVEVESEQATLT